jgi:hypothetical protein
MSAYVVNDSTINGVVSYLNVMAVSSDQRQWWQTSSPLAEIGYNLADDDDCKRLANDMFALNLWAVDIRYGKDSVGHFRPLDFEYRFVVNLPSHIQAFKSLECWLYQCLEGSVKESALYQAMSGVLNELALAIVMNSDGYNVAKWG